MIPIWFFLLSLTTIKTAQAGVLEDFGYVPSSDVQSELLLAWDIQEMRSAHTDFALKKQIYTSKGEKNTGSYSLQSLSYNASANYQTQPLYNIYRKAFGIIGQSLEGDEEGEFDGFPVETYADTLVNDLFLLNVSNIEAEAALSLNVYMAYCGALHNVLTSCRANDQTGMKRGLDQAAALWVGDGQARGDDQSGYMFYNMAQYVGGFFNQVSDGDSEVLVNTNVIRSLIEIQSDINSDNLKCDTSDGYQALRSVIWKLVSYANQVLMQMLIHRVVEVPDGDGSTDFVELYALAVMPQIAACDTNLYETLLKYTVTLNVDSDSVKHVIANLQQSYSCLDLTCKQMGAYLENIVPECDDASGVVDMAGYKPMKDVRNHSRIDRDIRQIRWMMMYDARDAAKDWFLYGRNSFFSLSELAKGERTPSVSEEFERAMQAFGQSAEDRDWLHILIINAFDGTGEFEGATVPELRASVDSLLRGAVLIFGVTNELERAINIVNGDEEGTIEDAVQAWETGVAFFIGSTEGTQEGGAGVGGDAIYGLANEMCGLFHVCQANNKAEINEILLVALRSGATGIQSGEGVTVTETYTSDIVPNLIVPVLQAMLRGSLEAGLDPKGPYPGDKYGYSRSVIAFFLSAGEVGKLLEAIDDETPSDTSIEGVFEYVSSILAEPSVKTDCEKVGVISGDNGVARKFCLGAPPEVPDPSPTTTPPTVAVAPTPATRGPAVEKPVDPEQVLGFGRFKFSSSLLAENDANVALDVKEIYVAIDVTEAEEVYMNGANFLEGLYGLPLVTNLSSMSLLAKDIMANDPIFNFNRFEWYEYGTWDDAQLALDEDGGRIPVLAAETTVLVHSFFIILRQLHEASRQCQLKDPDEAVKFLDSAVAIWLGDEQAEGKYNSGYMMYSQAQLARSYFGLPEAEAVANTELMDWFNEVLTTIESSCTSGMEQEGYNKIRVLIIDIARSLSKPMIQLLLYYIAAEDKTFTALLARAFVPQIVSCNSGDYDLLEEELMDGSIFKSSSDDQSQVLEKLASGLKCLGITCQDLGDATKSNIPSLTQMVNSICSDLQDSPYLAGYETTSPVAELSRLDLDLHRIDILMRTNAVSAAKEIYQLGYSSRHNDGLRSFKAFSAEVTGAEASPLAAQYISYFSNTVNYPDAYITNILSNTDGPYKGASRDQKAEGVTRMLQSSVIYLGVAAQIEKAQKACESGGSGVDGVDAAAALFIGSIEGTASGGDPMGSGVSLMGLGKEVCDAFDKCESGGDSSGNEFILFALSDYKDWIVQGECESAASVKNESLLPGITVSIIQAILDLVELSKSLSALSDDEGLAALDAFARAILPVVNAANATSAETLSRNTNFRAGDTAVPDGVDAVFDAFSHALRPMGVDCDLVGTLQSISKSVCVTDLVAPPPDTSTTLGDNTTSIYTSTTYVQDRANIALDVKQMEDDLALGRKDIAEMIYKSGENSAVYDKFGMKIGVRSLSAFSTNASNTMKNNPLYQITVSALQDDKGNYLGMPATQYAESIVMESFGKGEKSTLAAEAAVSLNLWMEVINELYQTLDNCKNQRIHDQDGIHSIDEVAAYWIGDGETAGDADKGHVLFNLAEQLATRFGTLDLSGQATVNLNILHLLSEARLLMSFPQACSEDYSTVRKLQSTVNKLVTQMLVVQVQNLIKAILDDDRDRVRVFAHGFVPLIKTCNSDTFALLKDKLIGAKYDETEADQLIGRIYRVIPCFGMTCDDIGYQEEEETSAVCEDPDALSLAGYRPNDDVSNYARLDLDIVVIDILMSRKAYPAAKDVYMFGRNPSPDGSSSLSLESLARSTRRHDVPEYNTFVQYYSGDSNYADSLILAAFESADMPDAQRQAMAVGGSQFLVMYMGVLEQIYASVSECKSEKQDAASLYWNKGAAYIIGSMEGPVDEPYDQRGGVFFWGVAKQQCKEWGTCKNIMATSPQLNNKIRSLLYTGRGAIESGACDALKVAADELAILLRTPLVQTALSEITKLGQKTKGAERDLHHARAYVAAMSLLPLLPRENAAMLSKNLDMEGEPLEDGAQAVETSLVQSMNALSVSCEDVGSTSTIDTCTEEVESTDDSKTGLIIGITLGVFFGAILAVLFFVWNGRKSKRQAAQEENKFVPNKDGVLDEADREFHPDGPDSNRAGVSLDEMDGANANSEGFHEVDLPEAV